MTSTIVRGYDSLGLAAAGLARLAVAAILAIEELLNFENRATMRDDRLHPVARQISKLHVLEEARHVSFAKTYLTECWPTLDVAEQEFVQAIAPDLVAEIAALGLDPAVFDHLGIVDGYEIEKANPNYQTNVVAGLSKLTSFLTNRASSTTPTHGNHTGSSTERAPIAAVATTRQTSR